MSSSNAYGSCARVRGGERSALCPMVCAHGRRQRREVARMDMRSYNEQLLICAEIAKR
jgi:hypothetical protein